MKKTLLIIVIGLTFQSCSDNKIDKKGFQVNEIEEGENGEKVVGLKIDSLKLETRPRNVLITKYPIHRLTPIYKVNYNKKTGKPFTGSNSFRSSWHGDYKDGNNWNNNYMPGFEAVYGYNFVNISHYNNETKTQTEFFDSPVLIKTLYYPAFSNDTLNYKAVNRDYYMVSVYNEDTDNDGFISTKDLRRFFLFDLNGKFKKILVPENYSVMSSEYDSANDFMYVFAKLDINNNGKADQTEQINIFVIDLKKPENTNIQFK